MVAKRREEEGVGFGGFVTHPPRKIPEDVPARAWAPPALSQLPPSPESSRNGVGEARLEHICTTREGCVGIQTDGRDPSSLPSFHLGWREKLIFGCVASWAEGEFVGGSRSSCPYREGLSTVLPTTTQTWRKTLQDYDYGQGMGLWCERWKERPVSGAGVQGGKIQRILSGR